MRFRIPLTLAIVPALIVRSAGQSFALPQRAISEFVRLAHGDSSRPIEWIGGAPLLRLRGRLLPLVFLNRILEINGILEPDPTPPRESGGSGADRARFIAVIEVDGRRFGLVVDGLADPEEIIVKSLHAVLKGIGLYTGATVLGNGEMALILDPGAIALRARVAQSSEASETVAGSGESGMDRAAEYLVVDASGRHAAVPPRDVLRIERIPSSRIERVGAQLMLHAGGVLLPMQNICAARDVEKHEPAAELCVVRVRNELFAIPICHIVEILGGVRPLPVPLAPAFIGGLAHYRGEVLTAVSLRRLLGAPPVDGPQDMMVLEGRSECFGLLVDAVGEVLMVSAADFAQAPSTLSESRSALFAGVCRLPGRLLPLLNPEGLDPMRLSEPYCG